MQSNYIIRPALVTALILLVPLIANRRVDGWNWDRFDFLVAGALLFGAGLTYELVSAKMTAQSYRFAVGLAVVTAFVLTWVNLAVGIIGDENPANLLYFGMLAVGFICALVVRFRPQEMGRILFGMAMVQMSTPIVALIFWSTDLSPGIAKVFVLNAFFAMLFAGSALLFRRAAQEKS